MARQVIPRLPPFADNCDNVANRTISAAWNALLTTELTDFSYLALAREVGVSPSALYRYYPNLSVLAGQRAISAMTALIAGLSDGFPYEEQLQANVSPHDRTRLIARAKKDYLRDILPSTQLVRVSAN